MWANILHVLNLLVFPSALTPVLTFIDQPLFFPTPACGRYFCFQYDNTTLNPPEIYVRFFLTSRLTYVVCPGEAKLSRGIFSWLPWYLTHASVKLVQFWILLWLNFCSISYWCRCETQVLFCLPKSKQTKAQFLLRKRRPAGRCGVALGWKGAALKQGDFQWILDMAQDRPPGPARAFSSGPDSLSSRLSPSGALGDLQVPLLFTAMHASPTHVQIVPRSGLYTKESRWPMGHKTSLGHTLPSVEGSWDCSGNMFPLVTMTFGG